MSRLHVLVGLMLAATSLALLAVGSLNTPDAGREDEALNARLAAAHARQFHKYEIVVTLVRGEIDLREAADRFRPLLVSPAVLDDLRPAYPAASETELLYRHVLKFVRCHLVSRPDQGRDVLARLEAEMAATFPTNPTLRSGVVAPYRVRPGTRLESCQ